MISDLPPLALVTLVVGLALSILLPLAVVAVVVRGYRQTTGNTTVLRLAIGIVLVTAVPTLMRLGFGILVPAGAWAGLVIRVTELAGLLVVLGVMHSE